MCAVCLATIGIFFPRYVMRIPHDENDGILYIYFWECLNIDLFGFIPFSREWQQQRISIEILFHV
jgi:hypothetical protein